MIPLLATSKNKKQISIKYLFVAFFVCISMVACLGLFNLWADEQDPEDNTDELEVKFQNTAQAQHADNVASQAALKDPLVIDLIKQDRIKEARAVYLGKVEEFTRQISRLRAAGTGWGDIAHRFGLHPSVLGLGHAPITFDESVHRYKHPEMKSKSKMVQKDSDLAYAHSRKNKQGKGLALGHSKNKSSHRDGGHRGGKGGGHGGGKGGGKK